MARQWIDLHYIDKYTNLYKKYRKVTKYINIFSVHSKVRKTI